MVTLSCKPFTLLQTWQIELWDVDSCRMQVRRQDGDECRVKCRVDTLLLHIIQIRSSSGDALESDLIEKTRFLPH